MTEEFYSLILSLRICADPAPLDEKSMKNLDWCLNQKAKDFGYKDWVDAYHKIDKR